MLYPRERLKREQLEGDYAEDFWALQGVIQMACPWARSYKQNSSVEFDSTPELANQISHVIIFSFSDYSIPV